jgi:probable rRNA maturation factor
VLDGDRVGRHLQDVMDSDSSHPIQVTVDAPIWRQAVTNLDQICATAVLAAIRGSGALLQGSAEVSILLTDDARIQELNRDWRGKDKPTNVLSFPALTPGEVPPSDMPFLLGDIVLAYGTVAGEAEAEGKPIADHLRHLLVHGVLHLLGHDHEAEDEAERMEALEVRVLEGLGVPDPYLAEAGP